jgi:nicotinamide mononucleotide adenylyltransferase
MGYQMSAGIVAREFDVSTVVPGSSTVGAATVMNAIWGPVNEVVLVTSEEDLVARFGKPHQNTFTNFFTAANFLSYSKSLSVVRPNANSNTAVASGSVGCIPNETYYEENYYNGQGSVGSWAARYPGSLGNTLKVSTCPSSAAYEGTHSLTANVTAGNTQIVFSAALSTDTGRQIAAGDYINVGATTGDLLVVNVSGSVVTVNTAPSVNLTANSAVSKWFYASQFTGAPGTSEYVESRSGSGDEMHIVIVDEDGQFGEPGLVLEKFAYVSKASDAMISTGATNYYKDVIKERSKYVWWMDHQTGGTNWGNTASGTTFTSVLGPEYVSLSGGTDVLATDGQKMAAYDFFNSEELIDVGIILMADHSVTVTNYVIDNIAEVRGDCVAFVSPPRTAVVNNSGDEMNDILDFADTVSYSTYAFVTDNWKYQFDKYNNTYRWVPDNGDIGGLAALTHVNADPWYSFAGYNRGHVRNAIKMAWKSTKAHRDILYPKAVNSIVTEVGEGHVLIGDKTHTTKPSAFDHINVRYLFIVLKKSIKKATKYTLFELNDRFTRAQWVSMVEPFLRNIQGRGGVTGFFVQCDEKNNTPDVIDRNEFVGTTMVKPARSINYATLNFVATPTGVAFEEISGRQF